MFGTRYKETDSPTEAYKRGRNDAVIDKPNRNPYPDTMKEQYEAYERAYAFVQLRKRS